MKIESLKKDELIKYAKTLDITIAKQSKSELIKAIYLYRRDKIDKAIAFGDDVELLKSEILKIADEYASNLNSKIINRREEMKKDDNSHYLIYQVLGISFNEGVLIDEYQNTGRFLYKYAGSFLEEVASKLLGRNYIGIDESIDAVELSLMRIENPVKTESNLLKKGRDAYVNVDKEALALLQGIEYNAVQRNKGIDAILVETYEDSPVLVRVQKKSETIAQSAQHLIKAMKIKKSKKSMLIQTQKNDLLDEKVEYDGVVILESPSLAMLKYLD